MLFDKIIGGSFSSGCIIKPTNTPTQIKIYGGIWYWLHLNKFELEGNKIIIDSNDNPFNDGNTGKTALGGSDADGWINASADNFWANTPLLLDNPSILLLFDNKKSNIVSNNEKRGLQLVSGDYIYSKVSGVPVTYRDYNTERQMALHIATSYNFQYNEIVGNHHIRANTDYYINGSSGIKTGQFIL